VTLNKQNRNFISSGETAMKAATAPCLPGTNTTSLRKSREKRSRQKSNAETQMGTEDFHDLADGGR